MDYKEIDQLKVWGHLIGVDQLGVKIKSPFRPDNEPTCELRLNKGKIKFFDWAWDENYDLVDAYRKLNALASVGEAIKSIKELSKGGVPTLIQIESGKIKKSVHVETYDFIQFDSKGEEFWSSRGVGLESLNDPQTTVRQISGYRCTGEGRFGPYDYYTSCFGFVYFQGDKTRRYCPGEKDFKKFGGSFGQDTIWHLKRVHCNGLRTLLIPKSHKDLLVWKRFVRADLAAFSSEPTIPSDEKLFNLLCQYDRVIISYDPDKAGIKASGKLEEKIKELTKGFNYPVVNFMWPDLDSKDIDGHVFKHGIKETFNLLKINNFYNIFQ